MKSAVIELVPAVQINMDNYKPYSNIHELRNKAKEYLKSIKENEFSLLETNPDIKFYFSGTAIKHILKDAGNVKLIITKQLIEIFNQGIVWGVKDELKGDKNTDHVIECGSYIMVNAELYQFHFWLKIKNNGKNFIYDGSFDIDKPEKDKTA